MPSPLAVLPILALSVAVALADGGGIERDIPYLGPDRPEQLDAYLPSAAYLRPVPAVVWIHGGGWIHGDKGEGREANVCRDLAANGYAAFSINYKLGKAPVDASGNSPAAEVPWPQNLADCKSALRFVRKEAARFGIDPARIAVAGGSAGGHLSLLAGLTGNVPELNKLGLYADQDSGVSCIVDLYGPTELTVPRRAKLFAGATPEITAENIRQATPATWIAADAPPVLIVHGDADDLVPLDYSRRFAAALDRAGVEHRLVVVPGAPHAFDLQPKQGDLRPVVLDFLARHLGQPRLKP